VVVAPAVVRVAAEDGSTSSLISSFPCAFGVSGFVLGSLHSRGVMGVVFEMD
jgi:hypothetical protein